MKLPKDFNKIKYKGYSMKKYNMIYIYLQCDKMV